MSLPPASFNLDKNLKSNKLPSAEASGFSTVKSRVLLASKRVACLGSFNRNCLQVEWIGHPCLGFAVLHKRDVSRLDRLANKMHPLEAHSAPFFVPEPTRTLALWEGEKKKQCRHKTFQTISPARKFSVSNSWTFRSGLGPRGECATPEVRGGGGRGGGGDPAGGSPLSHLRPTVGPADDMARVTRFGLFEAKKQIWPFKKKLLESKFWRIY